MALCGKFLLKTALLTTIFGSCSTVDFESVLPPITYRTAGLTTLYAVLILAANACDESRWQQVAFGFLLSIPAGMISEHISKSMDLEEAFGKAFIVMIGWIFAFGMFITGKLYGHVPLVVLIGHLTGSHFIALREINCKDKLATALKKIVQAPEPQNALEDCPICLQPPSGAIHACVNQIEHPMCCDCVSKWICSQLEQERSFSTADPSENRLRCSHCTLPFKIPVLIAIVALQLQDSVGIAVQAAENPQLIELIRQALGSGLRERNLQGIIRTHLRIPLAFVGRRLITEEILEILERLH